jgi:pimeloyl-ACP methyl ester carboxylesterase
MQQVTDYRDDLAAAANAVGIQPGELVQPADHEVRLNGLNFHYLDWGKDHLPHVVLLHGGGLTAHTWDMAALILRERYHLVALDARGHGDSDWSPDAGDDTNRLMVGDTEAFIDHLGYDRLALVGMSMGGMTAMRYAERHPERLSALVLVDVWPGIMLTGALEVDESRRGPEVYDRFDDFLDRAVRFQPKRSPDSLRYGLIHSLKQLPDGRWTWKNDRRPRPQQDEATANAERERTSLELWETIRAIRTPTLLMRGESSRALPQEDAERVIAEMADARLVVVPEAGHSVHSNNPKFFAQALDEFLSAL